MRPTPPRPAYRAGARTFAFEHRAFARLDRRARTLAEAAALAVGVTALWVWALPSVSRLWARAFVALAGALDLPAETVLRVHQVGGVEVGVPYWDLPAALPETHHLVLAGVGVVVLFVTTLFMTESWRPAAYLTRAALLVKVAAIGHFAVWPERFSYTLPDYLHSMVATGLAITVATPLVLGLTYYVQDLKLWQKAAFTAVALGYSVVLVPLQYALHGIVLSAGSLLWMPVVYLFLGVPLHVFALVSLYAWAMSWPGRLPALGVPAPRSAHHPELA